MMHILKYRFNDVKNAMNSNQNNIIVGIAIIFNDTHYLLTCFTGYKWCVYVWHRMQFKYYLVVLS